MVYVEAENLNDDDSQSIDSDVDQLPVLHEVEDEREWFLLLHIF